LRYHPVVRVAVDRGRCEANALCMGHAPEVFRLDDEDVLQILLESPPEELRSRVDDAVRACPRAALTLVD
jgi:ferredoxin